ncbi:GbsR/MarR family transcriptional regulator [Streptomyces collinus]|uniref:GbsR/MarR family transcriptional regulator n=1 Tax=Streptomyces collinus TaxID=42684 RepID=UPI003669F2C4
MTATRPSRRPAALFFTEQDSMTAADLCEELSISSGAVSTAIKQLIPVGLVERVPAPGSRRDHYLRSTVCQPRRRTGCGRAPRRHTQSPSRSSLQVRSVGRPGPVLRAAAAPASRTTQPPLALFTARRTVPGS